MNLLTSFPVDLVRILAAFALVLAAAAISRWQNLDLEKSMFMASFRAFIQLIAIGYALTFVFDTDQPGLIVLIIVIMVVIAAYTSGKRGKGVPNAWRVALISISIGATLTLGLLLVLNIFQFSAQVIIPIAGMVVGNSMNVCSLVMGRARDEVTGRQAEIEAALALGASGRRATNPYLKKALESGMTPMIDTTKTVGLIQLPGAMTGMILAGASPLEAVELQIVIMYMMIGAGAFTGLTAVWLTFRQFFTPAHQLKLLEPSN